MIQRDRSIGSAIGSKYTIIVILSSLSLLLFPRQVEAEIASDQASKITVIARAKIQKRIEIRPKNFLAVPNSADMQSIDISRHDCDAEARKLIKNCIMMIYEMQ